MTFLGGRFVNLIWARSSCSWGSAAPPPMHPPLLLRGPPLKLPAFHQCCCCDMIRQRCIVITCLQMLFPPHPIPLPPHPTPLPPHPLPHPIAPHPHFYPTPLMFLPPLVLCMPTVLGGVVGDVAPSALMAFISFGLQVSRRLSKHLNQ